MDDSSKRKGKEQESGSSTLQIMIPDDQTLPDSSTAASSSSSDPELIQEAKRLKLSPPVDSPPPSSPSPPRIDLSSIPPASRRPLFNPPPHALQSQPSATSSGPIDQAQERASRRELNPAELRIHMREERARGLFSLARQRASKRKEHKVFPVMVTRPAPGPSPLGPNYPTPYDIVKKVLSEMKQFLNNYTIIRATRKPHRPPKPPPFPALQPLSASASSSSAAPVAQPPLGRPPSGILTLEEVILMMDGYIEGIPKTVSAQEMEDRLEEFKDRVGIVDVDSDEDESSNSWYGLMKNSTSKFWEKMTDHFACETMESSDDGDLISDDDDDDQDDTAGADEAAGGQGGGSGSSTAPSDRPSI